MEEKEFEKYLEERYYPQVNWYDKKAIWNQKVYKFLQWFIIILAAVTSALVAIGTASIKTFKFQENWINYRTTCETLRKEIHYFKARIEDYRVSDDPMGVFVKRVESLISRENTLWLTVQEQKENKS